ncbi:MAG: dTDP-4-dehydrorhamnose 3,5-epimerase, partial [uncultured Pseudonocardia sp.]
DRRAGRPRDRDPRPAGRRPARARRRARLVQGELPAREARRGGLPVPGRRAEQRGLQPRGRRHARHPRRTVGQVRLGGARSGVRGDPRPARPAHPRAGGDPGAGPGQRDPRAAGLRQQLPDPRARRGLHLPRQRALVAGRAVHPRAGLRPGSGDRLADRGGRQHPVRQGPRPPAARRAGPV